MTPSTVTHLDVMNRLGRAMADPTRSRILLRLLNGVAYPADLSAELSLSPQTVSNHLACLRDCGIVVGEAEGRRVRYEITDPHLTKAMTELVDVVLAVDDDSPCLDSDCTLANCCD